MVEEAVKREVVFLPIEQPLNLQATMESGQLFRWSRDGEWYRGVIGEHGYALKQAENGLLVRTSAPTTEEAERTLRDFFRLDDDLPAMYEAMAGDEKLAEAIGRWRGLRILRQDPWECLISFVCSSVSNIPRISRNLKALAQAYGQPVTLEHDPLYTFPRPEQLAHASEEDLLKLGLGFRAGYVAKIVERVAGGLLDMDALRTAPYEDAKPALMELPGVGNKVADCVLLFSLEKPEGFPIDRWILRGLVDWYGHSEKARYGDLASWAQRRWGRNAGYVQQYMYHHKRLLG